MKSEEITELKSARDLAMRNAAKARKPECGYFGVIAQTLDACLPSIEAQQETITHLTKRVEDITQAARDCCDFEMKSELEHRLELISKEANNEK